MTELSYRDKLNKEEGRKWNLLVLIKHHLQENGYLDSADMLEKEVQKVGQTLRKFEVCDNIDLMTILQVIVFIVKIIYSIMISLGV
jgi:katanin p60 ATPase-containing subunit A1